MDFKDNINDAIKEGNVDHIADLIKAEQDKEWLEHGGPFGHSLFGEINSSNNNNNNNGKGHDDDKIKAPDIENRSYTEYVINVVKKTVKQEDSLIRQIVYTALSADTKDPINLGILAPTSEGKTYPVIESLQYFPKSKIWYIGKMSPMVLVRQKGILVDINNESIEPLINELKSIIKDKNTEESLRESKKEELSKLYAVSKNLIDLNGIVLVFLEPPHSDLWNMIKPILSHDTQEIEYDYVDKTDRGGIQTKKVVVKGWPACIFCSAKDESNWPTWPEIVSRFLITSPNMVSKKYEESNQLIAQIKCLPSTIRDQLIVSDNEKEKAKQCVLYLKQNLSLSLSKSDIWIPYGGILGEALKAEKGTDVRNTKRIFSLLNIIPLVKSDNRPKLSLKGDISTIATLEDLSEVLAITQNLNGLPSYKMKFFKEVFYPLFSSKTEPDESKDAGKKEEDIAVTTKELVQGYKSRFGKVTTVDNLKKVFLNELHNNGFIEEEDSIIDKRQKIYKPLIPIDDEKISLLSNSPTFDNFLQHSPILLSTNCKEPSENWLLVEILSYLKYRIGLEDIGLYDKNNNKQTIRQFISDYESTISLIRYFKKANYRNYYSKILGEIKYLNGDMIKDVKNYRIESDSIIKTFSDNKIDEKPEGATYICDRCNKQQFTYCKDIHKKSCKG